MRTAQHPARDGDFPSRFVFCMDLRLRLLARSGFGFKRDLISRRGYNVSYSGEERGGFETRTFSFHQPEHVEKRAPRPCKGDKHRLWGAGFTARQPIAHPDRAGADSGSPSTHCSALRRAVRIPKGQSCLRLCVPRNSLCLFNLRSCPIRIFLYAFPMAVSVFIEQQQQRTNSSLHHELHANVQKQVFFSLFLFHSDAISEDSFHASHPKFFPTKLKVFPSLTSKHLMDKHIRNRSFKGCGGKALRWSCCIL